MKIAISGASGFIGSYLNIYFSKKGCTVFPLNRVILSPENEHELANILSQVDIVINLAGAPINHRWTKKYKAKLYTSRIDVTRQIVNTINSLEHKPQLFISTSAVGYYSNERCHDDYSAEKGSSFLSTLCEEWEKEAKKTSKDVRLVITRLAVVLAPKGGAFQQIALPSRLGISTVIGTGNQPFPWIEISDLANALNHLTENKSIEGVVNLVTPEAITNKELTKDLAKHYKSFITIKMPRFFFQMLLGEASEFVTEGQCVQPKKLLDTGFLFNKSTIAQFCESLNNK